jgi:hypothetical protein
LEQIFRVFEIPQKQKGDEKAGPNVRPEFSFAKIGIFVVSAAAALMAVLLFPGSIALLAGMLLALVFSSFLELISGKQKKGHQP